MRIEVPAASDGARDSRVGVQVGVVRQVVRYDQRPLAKERVSRNAGGTSTLHNGDQLYRASLRDSSTVTTSGCSRNAGGDLHGAARPVKKATSDLIEWEKKECEEAPIRLPEPKKSCAKTRK